MATHGIRMCKGNYENLLMKLKIQIFIIVSPMDVARNHPLKPSLDRIKEINI